MADGDRTLSVLISTPERILYEGEASSVILPGERGVLEVLPFHKRLLTRLLEGRIFVDGKPLEIRRGVAKVGENHVTVIVEDKA
jgi:F-type H+-transporting ATPase subunit epsilon